jgi:hypothetical protein
MSARDELAALIGGKLDSIFGTREFGPATQDYTLADELIAAGYRKPRTITTIEELEAMAVGSMILDSDPDALLKDRNGGWLSIHDGDHIPYKDFSITLPATVIHEGDAE